MGAAYRPCDVDGTAAAHIGSTLRPRRVRFPGSLRLWEVRLRRSLLFHVSCVSHSFWAVCRIECYWEQAYLRSCVCVCVYVCVCMCVYVGVCVCLCVCLCVHTHSTECEVKSQQCGGRIVGSNLTQVDCVCVCVLAAIVSCVCVCVCLCRRWIPGFAPPRSPSATPKRRRLLKWSGGAGDAASGVLKKESGLYQSPWPRVTSWALRLCWHSRSCGPLTRGAWRRLGPGV